MAVPGDLTVRDYDPAADLAWAEDFLERELGGRLQARDGELIDPLDGELLVAALGERPVGLVGWVAEDPAAAPRMAEIRVLVVEPDARRRRIGSILLDAAQGRLRRSGVTRAWLVTTNDNLAALALYQLGDWQIVEVRPGAVDEARRLLKPSIPILAENGIPIRDELELAINL